jgi:hypothetical protein
MDEAKLADKRTAPLLPSSSDCYITATPASSHRQQKKIVYPRPNVCGDQVRAIAGGFHVNCCGNDQRMEQSDPSLALVFHRFMVCLLAERLTNSTATLRSLLE